MIYKKKWYEFDIKNRYKFIYKKYSLKDFWDWWSDNKDEYMEIRITDFKLLKDYATLYHIPYSKSGIYIHNAWQLEKIVDFFAEKTTIWFGINPKRRVYNKYGKLVFGGLDINISKIKFLFLDIDRIIKDGKASKQDLLNSDLLCNEVLSEFSKNEFNKNYCKICSGNGVQLLIKLDVPIEIPLPKYNEKNQLYVEDKFFNDSKNIIKNGIGKVLQAFSKKLENKYNVEIDKTCFNMGRVGALPYSFNFKYNEKIPRGIVGLKKNDRNTHLSQYIYEVYKNSKSRQGLSKKLKNDISKSFVLNNIKLSNDLKKNKIINLMLTHEFPSGGINNTLWYSLKILLHNNNIDKTNNEYLILHEKLKQIHNRGFSENGLEPQFNGNYKGYIKENDIVLVPYMINKYLRLHKIKNINTQQLLYHPPLFNVCAKGKSKYDLQIDINCLDYKKILLEEQREDSIREDKIDPLVDVKNFNKEIFLLRMGKEVDEKYIDNEGKVSAIGRIFILKAMTKLYVDFVKRFYKKWGEEMFFYMKNFYFDSYINYKSW